jgi:hypothetical protein
LPNGSPRRSIAPSACRSRRIPRRAATRSI